jgi:hypothetical protein
MNPEEKRKIKYHPNSNLGRGSIILKTEIEKLSEDLQKAPTTKLNELAEALAKLKKSAQPWESSIKAMEKAIKPAITINKHINYADHLRRVLEEYGK